MAKEMQEKKQTFVGIDLGKRSMECCRLNSDNSIERFKTATTEGGINKLLHWLKKADVISLEAGNQAFRIAKTIMAKQRNNVYVLNPGDLHQIYRSLKKTDKEDALKLARLIARIPVEELPVVPVPSDEIEDARRLVSEQERTAKMIATLKNQLHNLFTYAGITNISKKHLRKKANRDKVLRRLPEKNKKEADRIIKQLELAEVNHKEIHEEIKKILRDNRSYMTIAMSIPGVGPVTAMALYAYLGKCERFSKSSQVSYYAGLVPRVDISGDKVRYGHITKRGSKLLRRPLIQGAWSCVRSKNGGPLKEFYERLKGRIGSKKAIVATARKMVEIFYVLITRGEIYNTMPLDNLDTKLKQYGIVT